MTLIAGFLCENGTNTVLISDGLVCDLRVQGFILNNADKKIFRMSDGTLLAGAGLVEEFDSIFHLYEESPDFRLPSRSFADGTCETYKDKHRPDVRVWNLCLKVASDRFHRDSLVQSNNLGAPNDERPLELIMSYWDGKQAWLSRINPNCSLLRWAYPFLAVGIDGAVSAATVLAYAADWSIAASVEETIKIAKGIMGFCCDRFTSVGGEIQVEVLRE
jgi:hypothetical protein